MRSQLVELIALFGALLFFTSSTIGQTKVDPKEKASFKTWLDRMASESDADKKLTAVVKKLKEYNPLYNEIVSGHKIEDGKITELNLPTFYISNVEPLRALPDLKKLTLTEDVMGKLVDLSPLKGLKLTHLNISRNPIVDLKPLQGMPLEVLDCDNTDIKDLKPLQGMPLKRLDCHGPRVAITDISMFKGMPLVYLRLTGSATRRIPNLNVLQGMSLETLELVPSDVRDLTPLKGMPLSTLVLNEARIADLSLLKGMPLTELMIGFNPIGNKELAALRGMKLKVFICSRTQITDISIVEGMPLVRLDLNGNRVSALPSLRDAKLNSINFSDTLIGDLSPLQGTTVERIHMRETPVKSLAPLKGLDVAILDATGCPINDLTPLQGMKNLTLLYLDRTGIKSLAPLKGINLSDLAIRQTPFKDFAQMADLSVGDLMCDLPRNPKDLAFFKAIKNLKKINGKPVAEVLGK